MKERINLLILSALKLNFTDCVDVKGKSKNDTRNMIQAFNNFLQIPTNLTKSIIIWRFTAAGAPFIHRWYWDSYFQRTWNFIFSMQRSLHNNFKRIVGKIKDRIRSKLRVVKNIKNSFSKFGAKQKGKSRNILVKIKLPIIYDLYKICFAFVAIQDAPWNELNVMSLFCMHLLNLMKLTLRPVNCMIT